MKQIRIEYRIPLIYCLIGIVWIYFSDTMVGSLVSTEKSMIVLNVVKGFVYIVVTTLLLYVLLKGYVEKKKTADNIINLHNIELEEQNVELKRLKKIAEDSDHLKTAFLQNMSHEIRTPMNAIMGFAELLPDYYDDKEKLEHFTHIISQRCSDLLVIIDDILDISKIESGQLKVKYDICPLQELFHDLKSMFTSQQIKLGKQYILLDYEIACTNERSAFVTDQVKLRQIFINLIGNALKFTERGSIKYGCRIDDPDYVTFYVTDTGPGIPIEKQKVVFDRFVQLSPVPNKLYGGNGLGLSIVKGLVRLLDGEIHLQSEPDIGTTFTFTLPDISVEYLRKSETMQKDCHLELNTANKTLLVVEDDLYNAEYIKQIIAKTDLNAQYVQNGKEAVQIVQSQKIDLILMDIGLPDISGYEATEQILKINPKSRIIAQTAYAAYDDRIKALKSGCVDHIGKPLSTKSLLEIINKHLKPEVISAV